MKKIVLTFLVLAFLTLGTSFGQEANNYNQSQIDHLKKELSITEAQAQKVALVLQNYKIKAKNLSSDINLSEVEKKKAFNIIIQDKNNKLEKLLTEQQLEKIIPSTERKKTNQNN